MKTAKKILTEDEKKTMEKILFPVSAVSAKAELVAELERISPFPVPCSYLKSLYDCCLSYLEVKYHVHPATGLDINVGENFYLDIGIRNKSLPWSLYPPRPDIVFKNVRLSVYRTIYASPVHQVSGWPIAIDADRLRAGETEYRKILMKADQAISAEDDSGIVEDVARIYVYGEVDRERLFRVRKMTRAYHQIERT